MRSFLLLLFVFQFGGHVQAAPSRSSSSTGNGFNFYLAAGPNFIFPTSVRVGWNRWEAGMLGRGFVGFNKTFPVANSSTYSSFGLGLNADGLPTSIGFQAAFGVNYHLFWGTSFRAEMLANANLNGSSIAYALVGIAYGF